jgi:phosphohistidine phosphatase
LAGFATPPLILYEEGLYLAGRAALLRRLRRLDESAGAVLVIGHNPGLQELALALAASDSRRYPALAAGKFPTAVRASFAIDGPWLDLARSRHALTDYVTAKSLGA